MDAAIAKRIFAPRGLESRNLLWLLISHSVEAKVKGNLFFNSLLKNSSISLNFSSSSLLLAARSSRLSSGYLIRSWRSISIRSRSSSSLSRSTSPFAKSVAHTFYKRLHFPRKRFGNIFIIKLRSFLFTCRFGVLLIFSVTLCSPPAPQRMRYQLIS